MGHAAMSRVEQLAPEQRQDEILALLQAQRRVSALALAERFGVSEDSIRRDLRQLALQGLCRRVYGGALLPAPQAASLAQRRDIAGERKHSLGRLAAALVQPGQSLLIDAGSTNLEIAAALPERAGITVVTNAPDVAGVALGREGVQVLLLGGRLDPRAGGAVGAMTLEQLRMIRADLCFPGICALDVDSGIWAMDPEEAAVKRAMIACSNATVAVITAEKLATQGSWRVAEFEQVDHVVVDALVTAAQAGELRARGVHLHQVPAG